MPKVKAWTNGEAGEPTFAEEFEVVRKAVLQVTDIKTKRNKYYAIELHSAGDGEHRFRVFTHYGRTDDLETNPDAGQKECRYFQTLAEAEGCYQQIYRQKTSSSKGYREVALASSKTGSQRARGTGAGEIDAKTLERIAQANAANGKPATPSKSTLHPGVRNLVRYIYDEAKGALTNTVAAKITAHGIETPLGVLTLGQIEKGEAILQELYDLFNKKRAKDREGRMLRLSGDFYSAIPHRIGRSRSAVEAAVINSLEAFEQKQQTLQLMKDMLQVNGEGGDILFSEQVDREYEALGSRVEWLDPGESEFKEMADYVIRSQIKSKSIKVKNIFRVRRDAEWERFAAAVGNERLLFHGSRISTWVGILSRGILLPKIVVSMGVHRTDAGWLGHGIYFGDAACTSCFYTTPGRKKTRLMAIARVALGKMKDYTKITYGLTAPPRGLRQLPRCPQEVWPAVRVRRRRIRHLHPRPAAPGIPRRVHGVTRPIQSPRAGAREGGTDGHPRRARGRQPEGGGRLAGHLRGKRGGGDRPGLDARPAR
ncbi:WGR domain-containing protein [Tautonia sociabilis]|uniref:WGR domain-containing protein n=1 Tax=Tautonia sociabilis TaxID=2080755 RepID=A0A432MK02_9BACT|nr:WGR domain-containing protein [Tautonia sociabilis]RUL87515.1 WGR domain-containing protein [Tautonia sociabilis]